jgi:sec-independent protein translocase protein TatC
MATLNEQMTIIEHLEELRTRLIKSIIAILITATFCYFFSDQIIAFLKAPAAGYVDQFYVFGPMDGFIIKWKVSLYGGLVLASPIWAWQFIQFILPGLTDSERRFLLPGAIGMVVLFLMGTALGYMTLPATFKVLIGMMGSEITYLPTADKFISLVVFMLLAFGLAFQTPVIIIGLVHTGLLTPHTLRRQRRISYFVMFVFAQLVTPVADPFLAPMLIMAPMVVLYEVSIRIADRVAARRDQTILPTPTG